MTEVVLAVLCGMPGERRALDNAIGGLPTVAIFSGKDRLALPTLVPPTVKLMVDAGLCGGIGPPLDVPAVVTATTLRHKSSIVPRNVWGPIQERMIFAVKAAGFTIHPVPYFSDGLFNESDNVAQRKTVYERYPERPQAMSDETRFADALAIDRGIPLLVVRAISDSWYMNLPPAACGAALNDDGSPNFAALFKSLGRDPEQIFGDGDPANPSLMDVANFYHQSLAALEATLRAIAPVLADI